MDKIREELSMIPVSYTTDHLRNSYYTLLDQSDQNQLFQDLFQFVDFLKKALEKVSPDRRLRLLYEALSQSLTYDDTEYPTDQGNLRFSYIGGLRCGRAVCMGIAELLTLLGGALDLKIQTVIGYGGDPVHDGGLHAWNIVWLPEGATEVPYHLDLTWDLGKYARFTGYRYYLKSDAYMRSHDHYWLPERYPRCHRDCGQRQIPRIHPEAVRTLCRGFETLRTKTTNE